MFDTAIAGSLPKPAWLAETQKLWPQWKAQGAELLQAKADATLLWIKAQEDAGLDVIGDGEQARQHFVHGFVEHVEGIDFVNKVTMGIRNNRYDAQVPQVVAPLRLKGRVHAFEAQLARKHTKKKLKFTLPGPMTIVDTVADRFYGDKVKMAMAFAELLNQEALALQADGVDIIQFDEPAFNVYMAEAADWGVAALERAAQGLTCTTAVHICYGYGIEANVKWKETLGEEWRQYEQVFPALARSRIGLAGVDAAIGDADGRVLGVPVLREGGRQFAVIESAKFFRLAPCQPLDITGADVPQYVPPGTRERELSRRDGALHGLITSSPLLVSKIKIEPAWRLVS